MTTLPGATSGFHVERRADVRLHAPEERAVPQRRPGHDRGPDVKTLAGDLSGDMIYGTAIGEPVSNDLKTVGISAFFEEYGQKNEMTSRVRQR